MTFLADSGFAFRPTRLQWVEVYVERSREPWDCFYRPTRALSARSASPGFVVDTKLSLEKIISDTKIPYEISSSIDIRLKCEMTLTMSLS